LARRKSVLSSARKCRTVSKILPSGSFSSRLVSISLIRRLSNDSLRHSTSETLDKGSLWMTSRKGSKLREAKRLIKMVCFRQLVSFESCDEFVRGGRTRNSVTVALKATSCRICTLFVHDQPSIFGLIKFKLTSFCTATNS